MPNILSLIHFVPEIILSVGAIALILWAMLPARFGKFAWVGSVVVLVAALAAVFSQWNVGSPPLFWGMLLLDRGAIFFKVLFIIAGILISIVSSRSNELKQDEPEFFAILLGLVLGMSLLAQAVNILAIYLALEFVSLLSYLLVGYVKGSRASGEAAIKYLLYGAVASGIFLFGASYIFGATQTLDIEIAASVLSKLETIPLAVYVAGIFMLAGFFYKIAAFPMQAWCPDAYEGAPIPVASFLSVAPKAAGFAVLMHVAKFWGVEFGWGFVFAIVAAVTMTFGNLSAIPQNNVKRLLAYSSIAHAGYLLMGLACGTQRGFDAVYFYFVAYLVMNVGAFLVVQIVSNKFGAETIDAYVGLARRGRGGMVAAVCMTIFLLSLTGVPPFFGFIGKFYLFAAVLDAKLYWLAIVGIVNSVISLYYYMRIAKAMFFGSTGDESALPLVPKRLMLTSSALAILTIVFGIFWQWLAVLVATISA